MVYLILISIILANLIDKSSLFYIKKDSCQQNLNCYLPDCLCDTTNIPINITGIHRIDEIPQLIILTFDDDNLDIVSYELYKKLLEGFKNPLTKCPIKATYFISDSKNDTSYCLIRNLYENGNEIALSTLINQCPHTYCSNDPNFEAWSFKNWTEQILKMRERLNKYSSIPLSHLNGFRAPQLEPASNLHYRIIKAHKFLYDSSLILNNENELFVWPFTLDYRLKNPLNNNGPSESFNGLWELPLNNYIDKDGNTCLKLWEGHCKYEKTPNGIAKFLRTNFLNAFYKNRAPLVLNFLSDWLKQETIVKEKIFSGKSRLNRTYEIEHVTYNNLNGILQFINETLTYHDNVFFVTASEAIEWMQRLPYLLEPTSNITQELMSLLNRQESCPLQTKYDRECDFLKQKEPDYDRIKLKILNSQNDFYIDKETLADLQSESLFINNFIGILVITLLITYLAIVIYDKKK